MSRLTSELRSFILDNFSFGESVSPRALGDDGGVKEVGAADPTGMRELLSYIENKYGVTRDREEWSGALDVA